MTPRARAVAVLLLGAASLRVATSAELTTYLRPGVRWTVVAGAVVTILLAASALVTGARVTGARVTGAIVAARRERGADTGGRLCWLLLAPVVVFAIVRPPPLGALAANRPPAPPPRSDGLPPLPAHGVITTTIGDLVVRMVWGHGDGLRGRRLHLVGFVVRSDDTGFVLARLVITCCAADARPYDVRVGTATRAPPRGSWVSVTGTYAGADPADRLVPLLRDATVHPVARPHDPYE